MDDKELKRVCMGIINQLYDLTDATVESRQVANDVADEYLFNQIKQIILEYDDSWIHGYVDPVHRCGDCGSELQIVRPGKYQCPNC